MVRKALLIMLVATAVGGTVFVWRRARTPHIPQPQRPPATQPATKDTTPPIVTVSSPSTSQPVSGTITIPVSATDERGVSKVELYVDDSLLVVTYSAPFTISLDTAKLSNGPHTLYVKAYDTQNNVSKSSSWIITTANQATAESSASDGTASVQAALAATPSSTSTIPTPAPTDTTAPTRPNGVVLNAPSAYIVQLSWSASSDAAGVAHYKLYRDGMLLGTTAATNYTDYTVVPGNTYTYNVVAADAAGNLSQPSTEPAITLAGATIWNNGDTPEGSDDDPGTVELGVKFRPLVNGKLTGIRFYKPAGAVGSHAVTLWDSSGNSLATAVSSSESASGWQTVAFGAPIDVVAGTTYVASYFASDGVYGYLINYFAAKGISTQYLTALASGVDGNNGVFKTGASGFPTTSFNSANYLVDVTFAPNPAAGGPSVTLADNSALYPGFPGSNNTGVAVGKRLPVRDRGFVVYQPNTTIQDVDIQDPDTNKCIDVRAANVTISHVKVQCAGAYGIFQNTAAAGLVVADTEVTSLSTLSPLDRAVLTDDGATIQRIYIHTTQRGIWVGDNTTVEDSFVGNNVYSSAGHTTAIATGGGSSNVVVRRNNLRNLPNTNASSAISFYPQVAFGGPNDNFLIDSNLIATGGSYCVYLGHDALTEQPNTNFVFTNNKFATDIFPDCGIFGPVGSWSTGATGNVWTNNVWYGGPNDGQTVSP